MDSLLRKLAELYSGPLKSPEKALAYAKTARELLPDDPAVTKVLGRAVYLNADFKWAYVLLQPENTKPTSDAEALRTLAWSAYALGKVTEAEQIMKRITELAADSEAAADARAFLSMSSPERMARLPGKLKETSR